MSSYPRKPSAEAYKLAGLFGCSLLLLISIGAPATDVTGTAAGAEPAPASFERCQKVSGTAAGWPFERRAAEGGLLVCPAFESIGEAALLIIDESANETTLLAVDGSSGAFKEPILVKSGELRDIAAFRAQPVLRELQSPLPQV